MLICSIGVYFLFIKANMVKTESRKEAKVSARSAHSTNEDEDFTKSKMKESKSEDLSTTDIN